ncbi:hypothetical protein GOP47_0000345 [Adiantum capillus-veneris]|uniref:PRONE domain-containing protein n=1 Tax=Adiantum capillus-veneris TaxID=13818 RepID=A0A9D4ZS94_ADICA|nr:hypothetical protein GOP47_0000345 [Adiantum capillus-veneris]
MQASFCGYERWSLLIAANQGRGKQQVEEVRKQGTIGIAARCRFLPTRFRNPALMIHAFSNSKLRLVCEPSILLIGLNNERDIWEPCLQVSRDGLSSLEALSLSFGELRSEVGSSVLQDEEEDGSSSTLSADGSSPWAPITSKCLQMPSQDLVSKPAWDAKGKSELSELDMMKEKFSKLLLGEDMSGGAKGVSSALAISNAITNLSASVFGELWRLEPLPEERKALWRREMEWLVSVADHIVELVPSWQTLPDGSKFEVMVSRQRSDLHLNLPALRKLDTMLLETLDSFVETEFWYVDQGILMAEDSNQVPLQRQEEKWWLPTPKVPMNGLSEDGKKRLQHQRECINQVLKAAVAINTQVLAEMEIPDVYWDALPKSAKASLGETLYRHITMEYFSVEVLLSMLDLSSEHKALDLANRIEAAVHVWRRRRHPRNLSRSQRDNNNRQNGRNWGLVKEMVSDVERRDLFASRAEGVLVGLRQKFPSLRQSFLDTTKIQHNRDVGQSILESYSRVMESLAFSIISRIEDVLYVDDLARRALPPAPPAVKTRIPSQRRGFSLNLSVHTPYVTPFTTPSVSPTPSPSPRRTPNSPFQPGHDAQGMSELMGYAYEYVSVEDAEFR